MKDDEIQAEAISAGLLLPDTPRIAYRKRRGAHQPDNYFALLQLGCPEYLFGVALRGNSPEAQSGV
jgi:hypothetical protein